MTVFRKEADLCEAYLSKVPKGWTPYPETQGWDILLVHDTGFQIGIEAKLRLNPKVITQALDRSYRRGTWPGPDCRAVLVPDVGGQQRELADICRALEITVITVRRRSYSSGWDIRPDLPRGDTMAKIKSDQRLWLGTEVWFDQVPAQRLKLPEYVPDVPAGVAAPVVLGHWKIQAIKACIWVERHGSITRKHFDCLDLSPSRWMNGYWLRKGPKRGLWVKGSSFPGPQFRSVHPAVYEQIEADYEKWVAASKIGEVR
ncbi:MAG: hypothetical protein JXQ91_07590 [Vannielia sp.]|uniref:hypothetical protein n=1 Tax=Vannielia sp. TaxID=2813045 RepID=UPI003B8AEB85